VALFNKIEIIGPGKEQWNRPRKTNAVFALAVHWNKNKTEKWYFIIDAYRAFHNSRPKEKQETRDRIWMCNFDEKKSSLKDIREKTI
jgi:hypothetical protein